MSCDRVPGLVLHSKMAYMLSIAKTPVPHRLSICYCVSAIRQDQVINTLQGSVQNSWLSWATPINVKDVSCQSKVAEWECSKLQALLASRSVFAC